jgi:hypothetical protein
MTASACSICRFVFVAVSRLTFNAAATVARLATAVLLFGRDELFGVLFQMSWHNRYVIKLLVSTYRSVTDNHGCMYRVNNVSSIY